MVIRAVAPQITTFSLPFARFGIMRFGARGTLGEYRFSPPLQQSRAQLWRQSLSGPVRSKANKRRD